MNHMNHSFRVTSRRYEKLNTVTFVGRVHYYETVNGHPKAIWSETTGIHRLTPKDAQTDAFRIAFDRFDGV